MHAEIDLGELYGLTCLFRPEHSGSVDVTWRVERGEGLGGTFLISWRESGGPTVKAPARDRFGSTVIGQLVEMGLNATVKLDYASSGLVWQLRSPIGSGPMLVKNLPRWRRVCG